LVLSHFRTAVLPFLAALFLLPCPAAMAEGPERVRSLNENNITTFLEDMKALGRGQSMDMSGGDIYDYLDDHIADKAYFESTMSFEIPGMPREENNVKMTKTEYMTAFMSGIDGMESYETKLEIQEMEIGNSGRTAELKTLSTETGKLEWGEEENGEPRIVPVIGESECEQKIAISLSNVIQMAKAVCKTHIRFDPFAGKELDDPF